VRSILGRYLEHSRIFSFHSLGEPQIFIGSADMMHRNLDRRVEALVRLSDPDHIAQIDALFDLGMSERTSSWWLDSDGQWTRHSRNEAGQPLEDMQNRLMQQIGQRKRPGVRR
jgi:polyphosphate kinase